jgi:hypothetical protein
MALFGITKTGRVLAVSHGDVPDECGIDMISVNSVTANGNRIVDWISLKQCAEETLSENQRFRLLSGAKLGVNLLRAVFFVASE